MSATLGLSFTVEPWHFQPQGSTRRTKHQLADNPADDKPVILGNELLHASGGRIEGNTWHGAKRGGGGSGQRELWVKCEASMPPLAGTVYPYTREVFLGSYVDSFNRFQSISSAANALTKVPATRIHLYRLIVVSGILWTTWCNRG